MPVINLLEGSSSMCMEVEYPSQELVQESQDAHINGMLTFS